MRLLFCLALTLFSSCLRAETAGPEAVSFNTEDGGVVHADYYRSGELAVVLKRYPSTPKMAEWFMPITIGQASLRWSWLTERYSTRRAGVDWLNNSS